MKRVFYAILFTTLVSSISQAGYVGTINLGSATPNSNASLGIMGTGSNAQLTGTGLTASSFTPQGASSPTALTGGYLFFNTGTFAGTDASGNTLYNAGGNFFVLQQNQTGSQPVYSRDFTTGSAIVKTLTGMFQNVAGSQFQEYELTMGFSSAIVNSPVSDGFGTASPGQYAGILDFTYIVDPNIQGNQLISGTISFAPVPEPSSIAMVLIGGVALVGFGRRQISLSRAA